MGPYAEAPRPGIEGLQKRAIRCLRRTMLSLAVVALAVAGAVEPVLPQASADRHPMRDMMRRMMQGMVPPPGMTPDALPAPQSEGARLVARFCAQCHDLPSPRYKTAAEWPPVFERMLHRMEMMGGGMMGGGMMGGGMMGGGMMGRIEAPRPAEASALLEYLQKYGMLTARDDELRAGAPADRRVFESTCAQCHTLPSPSLHPSDAWVAVVARMEIHMQAMLKPPMAAADREAVLRLLHAATRD